MKLDLNDKYLSSYLFLFIYAIIPNFVYFDDLAVPFFYFMSSFLIVLTVIFMMYFDLLENRFISKYIQYETTQDKILSVAKIVFINILVFILLFSLHTITLNIVQIIDYSIQHKSFDISTIFDVFPNVNIILGIILAVLGSYIPILLFTFLLILIVLFNAIEKKYAWYKSGFALVLIFGISGYFIILIIQLILGFIVGLFMVGEDIKLLENFINPLIISTIAFLIVRLLINKNSLIPFNN